MQCARNANDQGKPEIRMQSPRVNTRLLQRRQPDRYGGDDIFEQRSASPDKIRSKGSITVVGGPERGKLYYLSEQYSRIGRNELQEIKLSGDDSVSRDSHAIIGFIPDICRFIIINGRKVNPVFVNGAVVHDAAFLEHDDIIELGSSELHLSVW